MMRELRQWFRLRGTCAALALIFATALPGCTFDRPESHVPTAYDFGPAPAYARSNPAIAGTVLVPSVRAPSWLDDMGIVYRLLYEDKARTQIYAMSKWAAEPAALLTDRLRARLAAVSEGVVAPGFSARSDYTLRVELDDFSQHFEAPAQSRTRLRARASLLNTEGRKLLAQRVFEMERPAEPNAPGAVKALTEAADAFLEDLVKWTAENTKKSDVPGRTTGTAK
jgi:cholesterol transport system auxiliary component